jgi:DNA-binding Lrp family transcriptional regulator
MGQKESLVLDEVDYRLLAALQKDGRMPIKDLAKVAYVSIPTVRARFRRFSKLGIIRFTITVDTKRILSEIRAFVLVRTKVSNVQSIVQTLTQLDEVDAVYHTTGEHDLVIRISVPDILSLDEFIVRKLGQMLGVDNMRSDVVVDIHKERFGFTIRPGFGVRIKCAMCKKKIDATSIQRRVLDRERFFCSQTCASNFQKKHGVIS